MEPASSKRNWKKKIIFLNLVLEWMKRRIELFMLGIGPMKLAWILFSLVSAMSLLGCGFSRSQPQNVLVVAVEGLGFDRVPCQNENLDDGFATLCRESIRFTHAY